jgi:hypothetical protein
MSLVCSYFFVYSFLLVFYCVTQINANVTEVVEGTKKSYGVYDKNSVKLFVFGDSFADTGNFVDSPSYKPPYGITFPGKPAGRFSDGRVLTDYIGNYLLSLLNTKSYC